MLDWDKGTHFLLDYSPRGPITVSRSFVRGSTETYMENELVEHYTYQYINHYRQRNSHQTHDP